MAKAQRLEKLPFVFDDYTVSMQEYKGDLYIGGAFQHVNNIWYPGIVKYNGGAMCWIGYGIDPPWIAEQVLSMAVYHGDLYVGGYFRTMDSMPVNSIARWDGHAWHALGNGLKGDYEYNIGAANTLTVYNDQLIVSGSFDTAGNVPAANVAAWDGTNWHSLGRGAKGANNEINYSIVYHNELYISGSFDSAGTIPAKNIAVWDGQTWKTPDSVNSPKNFEQFFVCNDMLYSTILPSFNWIGVWDGHKLDSIANPYPGVDEDLLNFNDQLYMMGAHDLYVLNKTGFALLYTTSNPSILEAVGVYNNQIILDGDNDGGTEYYLYSFSPDGDATYNPSYHVYPNPATNLITVESYYPDKDMAYELYNCAGQLVNVGLLLPNTCCTQIDVESLAPGLYFLRLKSGDTWSSEKVEILNK